MADDRSNPDGPSHWQAEELQILHEAGCQNPEEQLRATNHYLRRNLERFFDVVEAVGEFIWEADDDLVLTFTTPAMGEILGHEPDELLGRSLTDLMAPGDGASLHELITAAREGAPSGRRIECTLFARDGDERTIALSLTPIRDDDGAIKGYRGAGRDITREKREHEELEAHRHELKTMVEERTRELRRAEHHNRLLLDSIAEGIYGIDESGCFTFVNPVGAELLGYAVEDLLGRSSHALIHHSRADSTPHAESDCPIVRAIQDGKACQVSDDVFWKADGSPLPVAYYCAPIRDEGTITGAVVTFQDITERKEALQEQGRLLEVLATQAYYDELTGLPNRRMLLERMDRVFEQTKPGHGFAGILLLDLDRFQEINDSLGHAAGDWLLQRVAGRFHTRLPDNATMARLGGDEFAILLEDLTDQAHATEIAQALIDGLNAPLSLGDRTVRISLSIGISFFPTDGNDGETLLRNADTALHRAKRNGRSQYQVYTAAFTQAAHDHLKMETALRHALEEGHIELNYQPLLELSSGRLVGAEALARWTSEEMGGPVPPARFIPMAEETGLIIPLGEWVLRQAIQRARAWRDADHAPGRISVNLSPLQMEKPGLARSIDDLLREYALPGAALELEVTENAFLRDARRASRVLEELHEIGIGLAVDDFGTGYSSLSYLKGLPVDRLKIDQSFVRDLPHDTNDVAITRAVIALADSLGLTTLAEGIETTEQEQFLRRNEVSEGQGFLYSYPLSVEEFTRLLADPERLALPAPPIGNER
ncbi:MAG: EAL domain-containing protein [Thiohalospira sp.]